MIQINTITTNMLQEQTYILSDETNECVIIDPGFYSEREKSSIDSFLKNKSLKLTAIWFTHLHLDHIMGAQYIIENYSKEDNAIKTFANNADLPLIKINKAMAIAWGIDIPDYDLEIAVNVNDGDILTFGNSELKALHVPGHSPGSIVYYNQQQEFCIGGDVLFYGSIGRSDLYGGDGQVLINSINHKLMSLSDETTIFPGHGPATTIGDERLHNPYLQPQC